VVLTETWPNQARSVDVDARANGIALPNSREQIGGIGPGAVVNRGKWFFFVNAYHEVGAENMTEGNKLVLRVEKVF
jgi:hypothetical protein